MLIERRLYIWVFLSVATINTAFRFIINYADFSILPLETLEVIDLFLIIWSAVAKAGIVLMSGAFARQQGFPLWASVGLGAGAALPVVIWGVFVYLVIRSNPNPIASAKLFSALFGILWTIGYIGNGLLFLWAEYLYFRADWINLFNPFLHFFVLWDLVRSPLFWILTAIAAGGYYGQRWAENKSYETDERIAS